MRSEDFNDGYTEGYNDGFGEGYNGCAFFGADNNRVDGDYDKGYNNGFDVGYDIRIDCRKGQRFLIRKPKRGFLTR